VLVERETVDKEELEALLAGTWSEFLEKAKLKAAEEAKADKGTKRGKKAEPEPEPAEPVDDRPIVDVAVPPPGDAPSPA